MQNALRAEVPVPIEEVIQELETARKLPEAAMRAAVERADEIEPAVIDVIEAAAAGALLLPAECNLGLFGMHALAAARRTALYRPLLRMMRAVPDDDIEWLFGIDTGRTLPSILLSTFDGDASPLIEAAMSPEVDGATRIDLWLVLARLTFDGAIERTQMKALLERFERENLAQPGDLAWKGWQMAITILGLAELRERMHAAWADGRNPERKVDQEAEDEALSEACAAAPRDTKRFEEQFLTPIGDPVEELSRFEWTDDTADTRTGIAAGQDNLMPPLATLDGDEMRWLKRFLERHFTDADFAWEAVDGVCCAIASGPASAKPPNILALLDIGAGIEFDSPRQEVFVNGILTRYLAGVRGLLAAGRLHRPPLAQYAEYDRGAAWAACFLRVVTLDTDRWQLDTPTSLTSLTIQSLLRLSGPAPGEKPMSRRDREEMTDVLPLLLRSLYEHFHGLRDPLAKKPLPADFSAKVGRNEPCPCGSGKKFKRCCGGPSRPN
jgi:uncharacterized protein